MSSAYSKHTKINKEEIEAMMDNETYFAGTDELKTWGNVIENNNKENNEELPTKEYAETQVRAMSSLIKNNALDRNEETEQLAAILEGFGENNPNLTNFTNNLKKTSMEKEKIETVQDFKILYPKLYAEAISIGILEEKSRVKAHLEFIDTAKDVVINSIKEDIPFLNNSEIQAKYLKARINQSEVLAMEKDNNEEVIPQRINESKELRKETERENKEAEEKIKSFMPHLNNNQ
jgi:hypothetical protein